MRYNIIRETSGRAGQNDITGSHYIIQHGNVNILRRQCVVETSENTEVHSFSPADIKAHEKVISRLHYAEKNVYVQY